MSATMSILGLWNDDRTIFNGLHLPNGVNKTALVNNLLFECAEFEILYADPSFMKLAIEKWSLIMMPTWENLYETTKYEYDPISNYDRTEEWTDDTTVNPGTTSTFSQQGFNNTGFVDSSKNTQSGQDTSNSVRKGRAYGNIGVTTTQQMIEQERQKARFNIYNEIINDFKMRFCIMVY